MVIIMKENNSSKIQWRRARGQSLIELAIVVSLLMFILVGIVEYGFLLNQYLNLVDATRETARLGANVDPFWYEDDGTQHLDMNFFMRPDVSKPPDSDPDSPDYNPPGLSDFVVDFMEPLVLDPAREPPDDIVISFFSVDDDGNIRRFPLDEPGGFSWATNQGFSGQSSRFSDGEIISRLDAGAPPTGVLLIEVFYHYDQKLNLPIFNLVNPIPVHSFAIMPLSAAEPTPSD